MLNHLASELIGPSALGLELCARIEAVEAKLTQRLPTLTHLAQTTDDDGQPLSATMIAQAICKEAHMLAGPDTRSFKEQGNNGGADPSQGALREDAIRESLLTSSFTACTTALENVDTSLAEGRREAIEIGFMARNALITKVLMWGPKDLGRRHPTLALMLELRGGSLLSGISEYLSYVHAVDINSGSVPQRAKLFSVVGESGSQDADLKKWLGLKLHDINWFCPSTGIYALRHALTGVRPRPLDPRDQLCVISELEDLIEFGERRLTSMGVPPAVEHGSSGFSWRTFWLHYIEHLKLARRASTHDEMVRWVAQTVTQGKLALRLIGDTLRRFIDSAFPASASINAILPADNQVSTVFRTREDSLNTLLNQRDLYRWLLPNSQGHGQSGLASDIPRLSYASSVKALHNTTGLQASRKEKEHTRPDEDSKFQKKGRVERGNGPPRRVTFEQNNSTQGNPTTTLTQPFAQPFTPARGAGRAHAARGTPTPAKGAGRTQAARGRGGRATGPRREVQPRGGLYDCTNTTIKTVSNDYDLATPAGHLSEATKREYLHPGMEHIADLITSQGKIIIDLERTSEYKGDGTCGDITLAAAADRLGRPTHSKVLRHVIVSFALSEDVLHLRVTRIAKDGTQRPGQLLVEAIAESLQSWPPEDYEKAMPNPEDMGVPNSKKWLHNFRNAWANAILAGAFIDRAYVLLYATMFKAKCGFYCRENNGSIIKQITLPAYGIQPLYLVEAACVVDEHIALVVLANTQAPLATDALKMLRMPGPMGTSSLFGECGHGALSLIQGATDVQVGPICPHASCAQEVLLRFKRWGSPLPQTLTCRTCPQGPVPSDLTHGRVHLNGTIGSLAIVCVHGLMAHITGSPDDRVLMCNNISCIEDATTQWENSSMRFYRTRAQDDNDHDKLIALDCVALQKDHPLENPTRAPPAFYAYTKSANLVDENYDNGTDEWDEEPCDAAGEGRHNPSPIQAPPHNPVTAAEIVHAAASNMDIQISIDERGVTPSYLANPLARAEFTRFKWPLRSKQEMTQLLQCKHICPTDLIGFEFSAAMRSQRERDGAIAISADFRDTLIFGMHICIDVRQLFDITLWEKAFMYPPCFQMLRADCDTLPLKIDDQRTYWAMALHQRSLFVRAKLCCVEQPDSLAQEHYPVPVKEVRTAQFGDSPNKFVRISTVHCTIPGIPSVCDTRRPDYDDRPLITSYPTQEHRDRARSSWASFPNLCKIISGVQYDPSIKLPHTTYLEAAEALAVSWHKKYGRVPQGYLEPNALPPEERRMYQFQRGPGDGRKPISIIPASLAPCRSVIRDNALQQGLVRGGQYLNTPPPPSLSSLVKEAEQQLTTALESLTTTRAELDFRYQDLNNKLALYCDELVNSSRSTATSYAASTSNILDEQYTASAFQLRLVQLLRDRLRACDASYADEARDKSSISYGAGVFPRVDGTPFQWVDAFQPNLPSPLRGGMYKAPPDEDTRVHAACDIPAGAIVFHMNYPEKAKTGYFSATRSPFLPCDHNSPGFGFRDATMGNGYIPSWAFMGSSSRPDLKAICETPVGNEPLDVKWISIRPIARGKALTSEHDAQVITGKAATAFKMRIGKLRRQGDRHSEYFPVQCRPAPEIPRGFGRAFQRALKALLNSDPEQGRTRTPPQSAQTRTSTSATWNARRRGASAPPPAQPRGHFSFKKKSRNPDIFSHGNADNTPVTFPPAPMHAHCTGRPCAHKKPKRTKPTQRAPSSRASRECIRNILKYYKISHSASTCKQDWRTTRRAPFYEQLPTSGWSSVRGGASADMAQAQTPETAPNQAYTFAPPRHLNLADSPKIAGRGPLSLQERLEGAMPAGLPPRPANTPWQAEPLDPPPFSPYTPTSPTSPPPSEPPIADSEVQRDGQATLHAPWGELTSPPDMAEPQLTSRAAIGALTFSPNALEHYRSSPADESTTTPPSSNSFSPSSLFKDSVEDEDSGDDGELTNSMPISIYQHDGKDWVQVYSDSDKNKGASVKPSTRNSTLPPSPTSCNSTHKLYTGLPQPDEQKHADTGRDEVWQHAISLRQAGANPLDYLRPIFEDAASYIAEVAGEEQEREASLFARNPQYLGFLQPNNPLHSEYKSVLLRLQLARSTTATSVDMDTARSVDKAVTPMASTQPPMPDPYHVPVLSAELAGFMQQQEAPPQPEALPSPSAELVNFLQRHKVLGAEVNQDGIPHKALGTKSLLDTNSDDPRVYSSSSKYVSHEPQRVSARTSPSPTPSTKALYCHERLHSTPSPTPSLNALYGNQHLKPDHERYYEFEFTDSEVKPGLQLIKPDQAVVEADALHGEGQAQHAGLACEEHNFMQHVMERLDDPKPGTPSLFPNDPLDASSENNEVTQGFADALNRIDPRAAPAPTDAQQWQVVSRKRRQTRDQAASQQTKGDAPAHCTRRQGARTVKGPTATASWRKNKLDRVTGGAPPKATPTLRFSPVHLILRLLLFLCNLLTNTSATTVSWRYNHLYEVSGGSPPAATSLTAALDSAITPSDPGDRPPEEDAHRNETRPPPAQPATRAVPILGGGRPLLTPTGTIKDTLSTTAFQPLELKLRPLGGGLLEPPGVPGNCGPACLEMALFCVAPETHPLALCTDDIGMRVRNTIVTKFSNPLERQRVALADNVPTTAEEAMFAALTSWPDAQTFLGPINDSLLSSHNTSSLLSLRKQRFQLVAQAWLKEMAKPQRKIDGAFLLCFALDFKSETVVHMVTNGVAEEHPHTFKPFAPRFRFELGCSMEHFQLILRLTEHTRKRARSGLPPPKQNTPESRVRTSEAIRRLAGPQPSSSAAKPTYKVNKGGAHTTPPAHKHPSTAKATSIKTSTRQRTKMSQACKPTTSTTLPTINILKASSSCTLLFLVTASACASWMQPLILAHANGYTVIGAEMAERTSRSECLKHAQLWGKALLGISTISTLVGEYEGGARICATPTRSLSSLPTCRSPADRQRSLRNGATFVWCTLAALACTPCGDVAARVAIAMQAFVRPIHMLTDAPGGGSFITGVGPMQALDAYADAPTLTSSSTPSILEFTRIANSELITKIEANNADSLLDGWAERITPLELSEVPDELLYQLPDFSDHTLDHVPFSPIQPPLQTPWLALQPQQEPAPATAPACIRSAWDMLSDTAQHRFITWLNWSHRDLLSIRTQLRDGRAPASITRDRPPPMAIGQSEIHEYARNRVWDCRKLTSNCCIIADFHAPIKSDLNRELIARRLANYPDQTLLANLLEGVRLDADVELQTVLVPHLVSISTGLEAVSTELMRIHDLGWYTFHQEIPFWPMYLNAQGSTPKKLEPDRFRRTTEGGGPRREVSDLSGLAAISLNAAARSYHLPRHFQADVRTSFKNWLASRGLPRPEDEAPLPAGKSKWPKETKPLLLHVLRDIAILRRAAEVLSEPIYIFSDDCASYFNQLSYSATELPKSGIYFLNVTESTTDHSRPGAVYVSEERLGFGMHGASNIAQRFSDAILHLFREDMDDSERTHPLTSPTAPTWLAARGAIQTKSTQDQHSTYKSDATCTECRLYQIHMYCDDMLLVVVGADRAVRALRIWKTLVNDLGVIMAKPEKRHAGTHAVWLGVTLIVTLGICVVPTLKLLRAAQVISKTLDGQVTFAEYRSLCGLLEHLRAVCIKGRNYMYGLYEPHGPHGASRDGPDTIVHCSTLMRKQLQRWRNTLAEAGGVSVRRAILRQDTTPSPHLLIALCSDACLGDDDPPGIGGFCHGYYWYMAIPREHIDLVNTPLLEFLAVCGNMLTFHPYISSASSSKAAAVFRTDALTTALALPRESLRSPLLTHAFSELHSTHEFQWLRRHAYITHLFGDCNAMSDKISRARWSEFRILCSQLNVTPIALQPADNFLQLYRAVIAFSHNMHGVQGGCSRRLLTQLKASETRMPASAQQAKPLGTQRPTEPTSHAPSALTDLPRRARLAPFNAETPRTRPERPSSALTLASHTVAQQHARVLQGEGEPSMRLNANTQVITQAAVASDDIISHGVNAGTAAKDDRAWVIWEHVCRHFETAPIRSAADVREHPERITFLLTSLMLYVRMYCRPKNNSRSFIKPRSCLAYPLAIARIYKRWGIHLPGYKQLLACLAGMCRRYIEHHGPNSLTPNKVEPMKFNIARAIFDLPDGAVVQGSVWRDTDHFVFMFKRANIFSMNSGVRAAAITAGCSPTERTFIARGDIHYTLSNTVFMDPPIPLLLGMRDGDTVVIRPPRAKCDQWLEIHAHFPHTFTFHSNDAYNVARAIRDIEVGTPCRGSLRESFALFGDRSGQPFTSNLLNTTLRNVLTFLYGPNVASLYTWHSYRSGLASALHAAGTPEPVIMNICHWLSPDSLRSYRRISTQEQDSALRAAAAAPVALLQPRNAPVVDADVHYAALLAGLRPNTNTPAVSRSRPPQHDATPAPAPDAPSNNAHMAPRTPSNDAPIARLRASLSPALTKPPTKGEHLVVRRSIWPTYLCREHDGLGWEVVVQSATTTSALLRFTHAKTTDGRAYEDVRLPFNTLHPLPHTTGDAHHTSNEAASPHSGKGPRGGRNSKSCNPRGGCSKPTGVYTRTYTPPKQGALNTVGYPQLVPSDKCALCKTPLEPLRPISHEDGNRPSALPDRERLQCERCGMVRYCDTWCAHVHYIAAHHLVCPLPPFDANFNAEYVERRGHRTRVIPVRAIRTSLIRDKLNVRPDTPGIARTHAWSVVKHHHSLCKNETCQWCTRPPARPPTTDTSPLLHHIWFTALITRIRGTGNSLEEKHFKWARIPKWAPPLVIYASTPSSDGDPNLTWPPVDIYSRVLTTQQNRSFAHATI